MKIKIKQIFVSVMSLLLMITLISPSSVYAETYITGTKKHPTWWLADPSSGRRDDHEAELLINGERVFCIDAFTQFKSNQTMNLVETYHSTHNYLFQLLSLFANDKATNIGQNEE